MVAHTVPAAPVLAQVTEEAISPAPCGGDVGAADRGGSVISPALHYALLSQFLQGHRLPDLAERFGIPLDTVLAWIESPALAAFLTRLNAAAETQRDAIRSLSLPACLNTLALAALDETSTPAERCRAAALILSGRGTPRASRPTRTPHRPGAQATDRPHSRSGENRIFADGGDAESTPIPPPDDQERPPARASTAPSEPDCPHPPHHPETCLSPEAHPVEQPPPIAAATEPVPSHAPPSESSVSSASSVFNPAFHPAPDPESALLATLPPEKAAAYIRHRATRDRIVALRAYLASHGIREPPDV